MTKRCPKDTKHVQSDPNGCQEMPKTSQTTTKVNQKRSQIVVEFCQTELESTSFDLFEILGPFGGHLGTIFVPSAMKNTSKKATENQGRTNIENHAQRSQKLCQKASQIGYKNNVKSEFAISVILPRVPRNNWIFHGSRASIFDGNSIKIQTFSMAEGLKRKWWPNVQNVSKIDAKSMPKYIRKSISNEIGKMVDGRADRDPPCPADLGSDHGQKSSIQQSMWLVLLHPSIHWLSARRPNHKRGNLMCWNKLGNVPSGP